MLARRAYDPVGSVIGLPLTASCLTWVARLIVVTVVLVVSPLRPIVVTVRDAVAALADDTDVAMTATTTLAAAVTLMSLARTEAPPCWAIEPGRSRPPESADASNETSMFADPCCVSFRQAT